jgi:hypothetical protein
LHPFLADEQIGGGYTPIAVRHALQLTNLNRQALPVLAEGRIEPRCQKTGPGPMAGMAADSRAGGRIPDRYGFSPSP